LQAFRALGNPFSANLTAHMLLSRSHLRRVCQCVCVCVCKQLREQFASKKKSHFHSEQFGQQQIFIFHFQPCFPAPPTCVYVSLLYGPERKEFAVFIAAQLQENAKLKSTVCCACKSIINFMLFAFWFTNTHKFYLFQ